jgi:hypothetical protein
LEEAKTQLSSAESKVVDLEKSLQEQAVQLDTVAKLLEKEKQKAL